MITDAFISLWLLILEYLTFLALPAPEIFPAAAITSFNNLVNTVVGLNWIFPIVELIYASLIIITFEATLLSWRVFLFISKFVRGIGR